MNREESIKLLALIKVAYPTAYKDMDTASKQATVNMWQTTFKDTPYPIMEMAFNRFRMASKFPPTVAEMCEELRHLYWQATEDAVVAASMGYRDRVGTYEWIMAQTSRYKNESYMDDFMRSSVGMLEAKYGPNLIEGGNSDA